MKKLATTLLVLGLCAIVAAPSFAANPVRISMVYGGGGNSGAVFSNDFVELFNSSGSPVNISGWSLQYGSATGTSNLGSCTNCLTVFPEGSVIPACGYFLVQLAAGTAPAAALPTPDLVIPQAQANNLSGTNGKIGLKADAVTTPCAPENAFVDLVGYGTANCFETTAAGGLSNSTMAIRNMNGLADTDVNSADFTVGTATPRNSQSPANPECQVVPAFGKTLGAVKAIYR